MKLLMSCATVALLVAAGSAQAADVGVSVQISQPGVYGRIDIGRLPVPQLVLPTPVIIAPPAPPRVVVGVQAPPPPQPIYMWVPPGHQKDWGKHCHRYNACGVPVYFVQDRWYNENVRPSKGHGKGHGRDRDEDDDRGRGEGHGKGHGKRD